MAKRAAKRKKPVPYPDVPGHTSRHCLTVKRLIALLQGMPPGAKVRALNIDDPYGAAIDVEAVARVEDYLTSLEHPDAAATVRDARLRRGEVVIECVGREG